MASPFSQYPNNIIRPREVNWDVLSEAFEIVKRHWQAYVVYAIVAVIGAYAVQMCLQLPMQGMFIAAPSDETNLTPWLMGFVPLYLVTIVGSTAVQGLFAAGFHMLTIKVLSGRKPEISDAFEMFKLFVPIVVAQLLASLFSLPGICVCFIGYIFIYGMLMPAVPVVLVEKKSGWDAIVRAWELSKPHWLMMGVFVFVTSILSGLGAIACCVGILFTMPWAAVANFLVYRDLSGATFGEAPVASATNYPREMVGDMPSYSGPVAAEPTMPTDPSPDMFNPAEPPVAPDAPSDVSDATPDAPGVPDVPPDVDGEQPKPDETK